MQANSARIGDSIAAETQSMLSDFESHAHRDTTVLAPKTTLRAGTLTRGRPNGPMLIECYSFRVFSFRLIVGNKKGAEPGSRSALSLHRKHPWLIGCDLDRRVRSQLLVRPQAFSGIIQLTPRLCTPKNLKK